MEEQRHEQKKDIALRIKILHIIFILLVVYFLFHIVVLIFGDDKLEKDFEKLRDNFFLVPQKELAHRGTIYSRNGDVLATSITRTTVRIDFGCDRFRKMGQRSRPQRMRHRGTGSCSSRSAAGYPPQWE